MVWLLTEILVFVAAAAVFGGLIGLGLAGSGANRRVIAFEREHQSLAAQLQNFQRSQGAVEAKAVARAAAEAAARGDLEARLVDMEAAAVEYRARAEAAERRLRVLQSPSDSPELIEAAAPALADAVAEQAAPAERELQAREIESLRAQLALAERARAKSEFDLAVAQARAEEAVRSAARTGAGLAAPAAVEEGERPPGLAAPRGGKADDLRRIKGIGPRNEGVLNSLGLYHYEQIAALTPANVAWLDAYLKFPGRIARDDWVGQAKALLGQERQPTDKVHPNDAGA